MTPQDELERGQLAADIAGNRVYAETMAQMREEILSRWQVEADADKRDHLWRMMQCQKRFENLLSDALLTGKIRAKQLQDEQTRLEKAKGLFRGNR